MLAAAILLSTLTGSPLEPPLALFPSGQSQTIHIVQWDGNALPKPIQRSEQLPLKEEDLLKLQKAGFGPDELIKMIEERRCACDASADGMIRLKREGLPKAVLSAVSLHGLRPNRSLPFDVALDFVGEGNRARNAFFYFFVDDGDVTRSFAIPIEELLSRHWSHEEMIDRSDLLIGRQVRRIRVAGEVPLKTYGKHTLLVAFSANPAVVHPSQLLEAERAAAQGYTFEYPPASLESVCRVNAAFKRDVLLPETWHFQGSRFECEWN